ncbi:MAG: hemin ABC transporter substrate-binding protein, partial [Pseudomonadota bacterium]
MTRYRTTIRRFRLADQIGLTLTVVLFCLGAWASGARAIEPPSRVVSLGSSVTEIIYALGEQGRLVARDSTSTFPPAVLEMPDVGYLRALSPESVISMRPDLILSEEGAGPIEAIELLRSTQIPFAEVPEDYSTQGIVDKIRSVGAALGTPEKAHQLAAEIETELRMVAAEVASETRPRKRVMFVLSTQDGRIMASGVGTSADAMIAMAGGDNALASFDGYKPVTPEAIAGARPDVILMMDRMGDHATSNADLFAMPAFRTTPAAQHNAVIRM